MSSSRVSWIAGALLSASIALPALAQSTPPAPPAPPPGAPMRAPLALPGIGFVGGALSQLSPEGRAILREAVQQGRERGDRVEIEAARSRILQLIAADRFDARALERAMLEERELVRGQQERQQAVFIAALQRLSPADRKVLASAGLQARDRVAERRGRMMERMKAREHAAPVPPAP